MLNDNESNYETLLEKSSKPTMIIKRMRNLAIEIFKTINNFNPPFLKEIFQIKVNPRVRPNDIIVKAHNTATYGDKSLTVLSPKIWNSLPENVNLKAVIEDLRNILIHGLVPSVATPTVNNLQEKPR